MATIKEVEKPTKEIPKKDYVLKVDISVGGKNYKTGGKIPLTEKVAWDWKRKGRI